MDSPLAGARDEGKDLVVGASTPRELECIFEPYRPNHVAKQRRRVVAVSEQAARASADHYARWYAQLTATLADRGWRISPGDPRPVRAATLYGSDQHDLEWTFDAGLGRYVLTLSTPPWDRDVVFVTVHVVSRTRGAGRCGEICRSFRSPDEGDRQGVGNVLRIGCG
ncbi:MAG: hypothetical protein KC503_34090, partial [Myxococcales bacterium]|nr:hypothetical protein [Myxococcales bacterium]